MEEISHHEHSQGSKKRKWHIFINANVFRFGMFLFLALIALPVTLVASRQRQETRQYAADESGGGGDGSTIPIVAPVTGDDTTVSNNNGVTGDEGQPNENDPPIVGDCGCATVPQGDNGAAPVVSTDSNGNGAVVTDPSGNVSLYDPSYTGGSTNTDNTTSVHHSALRPFDSSTQPLDDPNFANSGTVNGSNGQPLSNDAYYGPNDSVALSMGTDPNFEDITGEKNKLQITNLTGTNTQSPLDIPIILPPITSITKLPDNPTYEDYLKQSAAINASDPVTVNNPEHPQITECAGCLLDKNFATAYDTSSVTKNSVDNFAQQVNDGPNSDWYKKHGGYSQWVEDNNKLHAIYLAIGDGREFNGNFSGGQAIGPTINSLPNTQIVTNGKYDQEGNYFDPTKKIDNSQTSNFSPTGKETYDGTLYRQTTPGNGLNYQTYKDSYGTTYVNRTGTDYVNTSSYVLGDPNLQNVRLGISTDIESQHDHTETPFASDYKSETYTGIMYSAIVNGYAKTAIIFRDNKGNTYIIIGTSKGTQKTNLDNSQKYALDAANNMKLKTNSSGQG